SSTSGGTVARYFLCCSRLPCSLAICHSLHTGSRLRGHNLRKRTSIARRTTRGRNTANRQYSEVKPKNAPDAKRLCHSGITVVTNMALAAYSMPAKTLPIHVYRYVTRD